MEKKNLFQFISKYHLGRNVESVVWVINDNKLSTKPFLSENKVLLGEVTLKQFDEQITINHETTKVTNKLEFGIYATSPLQKLVSFLDDDIDLSFVEVNHGNTPYLASMGLETKNAQADFALSTIDVIDVPEKKNIPTDYELKIKVDDNFSNLFIKAKDALPEAQSFTVIENDIIIGDQENNSNRITFPVETEGNLTKQLDFSASIFREVLSVNKDCDEAYLKISSVGIAYIRFETDLYLCDYYLPAIRGK